MSYINILKEVVAGTLDLNSAYIKQIEMLNAKLDPRLVASRSQSGQSLSYIEAHVAIQILNYVFGVGNWDMNVDDFREVMRESYEKNGKTMYKVGYAAMGKLTVRFINGVTGTYGDSGYGSGITSTGPGDAAESALKESESDLLKRCARHIGIALQLYDKEQRRVGFDENTIIVLPISVNEIREEARKSEAKKNAVVKYLEDNGVALGDLDSAQIEALFKQLINLK